MASKYATIRNITSGCILAENARIADTFVSRMIGLLRSPPLQPGEGLLIKPCSQIHMFGMAFGIDVVFFDKGWHVVGLAEGIAPGQISRFFPKAVSCLELPVGRIAQTKTGLGDHIECNLLPLT